MAVRILSTYSPDVGAGMESPRAVRVLVGEHQAFYRHGLRELIESDGMQVVAEAADGRTAVRLANAFQPDVVLLDCSLTGADPIEATRELARGGEGMRVILLSESGDDADVVEAVLAGACGYLLKDVSAERLLNAIRGAVEGEVHLSPPVTGRLAARIRDDVRLRRITSGAAAGLTERESQILRLLAQGHENHEIAAQLWMSPSTVKRHVGSILEKLQVQNRTQAAVYAAKHALD
jgi:two-component system, NarL family, response regulator LiaR